jgi:hypothetical protein
VGVGVLGGLGLVVGVWGWWWGVGLVGVWLWGVGLVGVLVGWCVTATTEYWHSSTRTVTLTVTDAKGQTNSVTKTITIP